MPLIRANEIANNWRTALIKAILVGNLSAFKELCVNEPVAVVLQNDEGTEVEYTVGDGQAATLTQRQTSSIEYSSGCFRACLRSRKGENGRSQNKEESIEQISGPCSSWSLSLVRATYSVYSTHL
jgi:hypothetical protein